MNNQELSFVNVFTSGWKLAVKHWKLLGIYILLTLGITAAAGILGVLAAKFSGVCE